MPHFSHANYIKTARVSFWDNTKQSEKLEANKVDSMYLDLANPKALKNKLGGKPQLEEYIPSKKDGVNDNK